MAGLGFPRFAALWCGGLSGSSQNVLYSCPTSQSKGLPAVPAGKVSFFIGKRLRCQQSRGQPLTVTLALNMREPNFSESQLQQAVNSAYIRYLFETRGNWVFANVPSLFDEFNLGWDSAFYFPWLPQLPADDHEGCNFFLQYKLSGHLTSAGAKEWSFWNNEYFRFKIPHSTRNASGTFLDDYHQWDRLKELANLNYPTFYVTNSTLSKNVLKNEYSSGTLLNSTPLLDVRLIAKESLNKSPEMR